MATTTTYESKLFKAIPANVEVKFWEEAENIAIRQQNYLIGKGGNYMQGGLKQYRERQYANVCRWYEMLKAGTMPVGLNWSGCTR